jgi:hypothetical protein
MAPLISMFLWWAGWHLATSWGCYHKWTSQQRTAVKATHSASFYFTLFL